MSEFNCENCEVKVAEYKDGAVVVYCHSEKPEKALQIPLEKILAAAVLEEKSLEILMEFYLKNQNLKFL